MLFFFSVYRRLYDVCWGCEKNLQWGEYLIFVWQCAIPLILIKDKWVLNLIRKLFLGLAQFTYIMQVAGKGCHGVELMYLCIDYNLVDIWRLVQGKKWGLNNFIYVYKYAHIYFCNKTIPGSLNTVPLHLVCYRSYL